MPKITKKPSVFLSHSSKDNEFVRRLEKGLKKNGIEVWVDYDRLDIGDSLYGEIAPAIDTSDYFALLWSDNSSTSPWVKRELNAALAREDAERREIILPVLLGNIPLPTFLKHQVYADFTSDDKFDESLKRLVKAIKKAVPEPVGETKSDSLAAKFYPNHFLPDLKFFVGREELLKTIKETLSTDHRAAIHDISGLGKTFTTYKFAHDNQANYEKIFFIRATREEMLESLAKCGELVNPALAEVTEQQAKALGFKQWLEENERWLVIYDNVDLPDELFKYVPVNRKGDCVFTSNFKEVVSLVTKDSEIRIEKLDKKDAGILLYSRAENEPYSEPKFDNAEDEAAFQMLIEEIDGLPLTLNSTGAFISQRELTFSEFRRMFESAPDIIWTTEDDFSTYKNRQQKSAGKVFSLVYDELCKAKETGKAVKTILDAVSLISPDEIPSDLLLEILKKRYKPFAKKENIENFWNEVRKSLTAYDLLKYDKQKKTFTTHRAIQRVIQSRLKDKEKDICIALASILSGLFPMYDYLNRETCEKYYQHVIVLLENADKLGAKTKGINWLNFRVGRYHRLLGNYALAAKFHFRAAEISAYVFGAESADHASDLDNLAGVYKDQGKYKEAIEKYEEALRIGEKTIGREHPDYAGRLNNLAGVYYFQGRHDDAIEKYEEALRIGEKTIGRKHPDYATGLNNLANIYSDQGRYDAALEKFEEALRIDEETIGRDHPSYAIDLNNLANVYSYQGRYDEAIKKYEEAMHITEKTLGREHPSYAVRLNNLADVYERQGKFREAFDLYKNALRIFEKTLPEGHPYISTLRENVERCGKLVK